MGCEFAQLLRPTISSLIQRIYLNPDAGLLFWIPPSFNINSMADLLLKIAIFFGLVMMKILLFVLERFVPHQDTRKRRTKVCAKNFQDSSFSTVLCILLSWSATLYIYAALLFMNCLFRHSLLSYHR